MRPLAAEEKEAAQRTVELLPHTCGTLRANTVREKKKRVFAVSVFGVVRFVAQNAPRLSLAAEASYAFFLFYATLVAENGTLLPEVTVSVPFNG